MLIWRPQSLVIKWHHKVRFLASFSAKVLFTQCKVGSIPLFASIIVWTFLILILIVIEWTNHHLIVWKRSLRLCSHISCVLLLTESAYAILIRCEISIPDAIVSVVVAHWAVGQVLFYHTVFILAAAQEFHGSTLRDAGSQLLLKVVILALHLGLRDRALYPKLIVIRGRRQQSRILAELFMGILFLRSEIWHDYCIVDRINRLPYFLIVSILIGRFRLFRWYLTSHWSNFHSRRLLLYYS